MRWTLLSHVRDSPKDDAAPFSCASSRSNSGVTISRLTEPRYAPVVVDSDIMSPHPALVQVPRAIADNIVIFHLHWREC
jgi:hypothetical protein